MFENKQNWFVCAVTYCTLQLVQGAEIQYQQSLATARINYLTDEADKLAARLYNLTYEAAARLYYLTDKAAAAAARLYYVADESAARLYYCTSMFEAAAVLYYMLCT